MYGLLSRPISRFFFKLAVDGSSLVPALKISNKHLDPVNQCLVPIVRKNVVFKINGSKMKTAVSLSLEGGGKMGSGGGLTQLFMLRILKHPIGRC